MKGVHLLETNVLGQCIALMKQLYKLKHRRTVAVLRKLCRTGERGCRPSSCSTISRAQRLDHVMDGQGMEAENVSFSRLGDMKGHDGAFL